MNFENPDYDTSMRVWKKDRARMRSVAGRNDAQRVRIMNNSIEIGDRDPVTGELDDYQKGTIQLNSNDKEVIESLPGKTLTHKFSLFVQVFEEQHDIVLSDTGNFVPM